MILSLVAALALHVVADAPKLFYLEPKGATCKAQMRDLASGAVTTAFEASECPKHVLMSPAKQKVVYAAKGHVWIATLGDATAKPVDLGALPSGVERLFLVEGTRNIRATALVAVPEASVVTKGDKVTYSYKGKKLDASAQPPFGSPFVAILFELDAKGAWKEIDAKATKWEAGDTLGAAVLDTSNTAKDVVEIAQLLKGGTCVGGALDCDTQNKGATKLVGKKEDAMVGVLLDEKKSAVLAFSVMFGDTPHAVPPVFACQKGCATGTKLDVTGTQLGISRAGGFVLIAEEYSGNDPIVFDASGKEVARMKGAQSAVFLPQ